MADKENSNYKVSINGKELIGEEAKQYAEQMVAKFNKTFSGFYTKGLEKIQSEELRGNLMESLKPLKNLEGLFTKNSSDREHDSCIKKSAACCRNIRGL
ncbi:hypothetical protein [Sporosarcina globispora]|uniref:hypothetical protein n=1 Tax=Sporosarcina globispora TaxID=1459 RepID=UPI000AAFB3D7|nr:hypothetical protein [Sporosarcina globispora]